MAVRINREAHFGPNSKGFQFELRPNESLDRETYQKGCRLEAARFEQGSVAQRVFERLRENGRTAQVPDQGRVTDTDGVAR